MDGALRYLGLLVLGLLAALTGCNPGVMKACYGPQPVESDPTVKITDFSYEPAGVAHAGDTLAFTVSTNKPFQGDQGWIQVNIGNSTVPLAGFSAPTLMIGLNDYGISGDVVADDGVWGGDLEWQLEYGSQQSLPVAAQLRWYDGYVKGPVFASPLTVLPAQDASS